MGERVIVEGLEVVDMVDETWVGASSVCTDGKLRGEVGKLSSLLYIIKLVDGSSLNIL